MQSPSNPSKMQNWMIVDVNMKRRRNQSQIYTTEKVKMAICREEEKKVKYTEPKYCRCQYLEMVKSRT